MGVRVCAIFLLSVLEALADPVADFRILDMDELRSDRAAVDGAEVGDHLPEWHPAVLTEKAGGNEEVEIFVLEAELAQA